MWIKYLQNIQHIFTEIFDYVSFVCEVDSSPSIILVTCGQTCIWHRNWTDLCPLNDLIPCMLFCLNYAGHFEILFLQHFVDEKPTKENPNQVPAHLSSCITSRTRKTSVASFTSEVNPRLAKRPLKLNGRLANRELTSLVKKATGDRQPTEGPKSKKKRVESTQMEAGAGHSFGIDPPKMHSASETLPVPKQVAKVSGTVPMVTGNVACSKPVTLVTAAKLHPSVDSITPVTMLNEIKTNAAADSAQPLPMVTKAERHEAEVVDYNEPVTTVTRTALLEAVKSATEVVKADPSDAGYSVRPIQIAPLAENPESVVFAEPVTVVAQVEPIGAIKSTESFAIVTNSEPIVDLHSTESVIPESEPHNVVDSIISVPELIQTEGFDTVNSPKPATLVNDAERHARPNKTNIERQITARKNTENMPVLAGFVRCPNCACQFSLSTEQRKPFAVVNLSNDPALWMTIPMASFTFWD